jgi:acyl carrier protein
MEVLREAFCDVFDDNTVILFPEMTAMDYEGWDSLAHIQLIFSVEQKLGVKFSTSETLSLKNIGDFVKLIDSKKKNNTA